MFKLAKIFSSSKKTATSMPKQIVTEDWSMPKQIVTEGLGIFYPQSQQPSIKIPVKNE